MIELIYNEEGEVTTEEKALSEPKNKKQIGEPGEYKKIFVEDYVHTFLMQYTEKKAGCIGAAILLGKSERGGGRRHLYICGALPVEQVSEKQGKYCFSEKLWGEIYQNCEKHFPGQEIMGWFMTKPGILSEKTSILEETHRTYFSGADKVLCIAESGERKQHFWGFDGNRFTKQLGYFIYYEKNELMREFLLEKNVEKPQTKEKPDVAVANFRKILKEKQAKNVRRKKQVISYGMKVTIALVLFVGAVTLKNQTDKIKMMEQQMNTPSEELLQETSADAVIVEELAGNVEGTQKNVCEELVAEENTTESIVSEEPVTEENAEQSTTAEESVAKETTEKTMISEEAATEKTIAETAAANTPIEEDAAAEELPVTENQELSVEEAPKEEATPAVEVPSHEKYIVQAGDTLAKISRDKYGTDEMIGRICELNEISDGDYIQEGEIILLP